MANYLLTYQHCSNNQNKLLQQISIIFNIEQILLHQGRSLQTFFQSTSNQHVKMLKELYQYQIGHASLNLHKVQYKTQQNYIRWKVGQIIYIVHIHQRISKIYIFVIMQRKNHLPNLIFDDFSKIRPEIRNYYENYNIPRQYFQNQLNTTDFEQALEYILNNTLLTGQAPKNQQIVALGGFGGRLDKTLCNISTAIKYSLIFEQQRTNTQIFLVNNSSLITCMLPGKTRYGKTRHFEHHKGVGLVQIYDNTIIRSHGLKWDLDQQWDGQMGIGKFLSTNNEFIEEEVYVETNKPIIFITKLIKF